MNNDDEDVAFIDNDDVLVYKNLQIDLDKIHPVVKMQGVLYDVANGITGEVRFDGIVCTEDASGEHLRTRHTGPHGGIFYTEGVSANSVYCHACYTDTRRGSDTDIYYVANFRDDDVDFNKHLCVDCAEGIADALEDYINDNVGELLGDAL